MPGKPGVEVEIKLPVGSLPILRRRLRAAGLRRTRGRVLEVNWILDDAGASLRRSGRLLRLRRSGPCWTLTAKGPLLPGRHKRRPETEVEIADGPALQVLLRSVGLTPRLVYERYRTTFQPAGAGEAVLDETPLGAFLELEGPAAWIDRTARALGYRREQYILESYADLFRAWVAQTGSRARQFTFAALAAAQPGVSRRR